MNCEECKDFIDGVCFRAEQEKIHDITDISCLLKLQITLLRNILGALYEDDDY
jgi:hypothetical protein